MSRYCVNRFAMLLGTMFALGIAPGAVAADKLFVHAPVYDKNANVNPKIKEECTIEGRVWHAVKDSAKGGFEVASDPVGAKNLRLTITNVLGVGGGAWSGPKGISLEGTLTENNKVIGTFKAQRTSSGGAFGGYKGTCSILERCAKALGKDISQWLVSPSMNAGLGEAK